MKATIRYTKYEHDRHGDDAIVRVTEITHCVPVHKTCTAIYLTNGKYVYTSTALDELENRIDAAERADSEIR